MTVILLTKGNYILYDKIAHPHSTYMLQLKKVHYFKGKSIKWIQQRYLSSNESVYIPKIGVIGSGPAGQYTCKYILEKSHNENIPLKILQFDKSPLPFGLLRYGVAPDHSSSKIVMKDFYETVQCNPQLEFYGNIAIDTDLSQKVLMDSLDAVVIATGANISKKLNIDGEDSKNVYNAKDFVSWYNGYPGAPSIQLDSVSDVVIIGYVLYFIITLLLNLILHIYTQEW